jgi:hypothetical protein
LIRIFLFLFFQLASSQCRELCEFAELGVPNHVSGGYLGDGAHT